jgi:Peptidase family M28
MYYGGADVLGSGEMSFNEIASRFQLSRRLIVALSTCVACAVWSSAQNSAQTQFRLQPRATVEKRLKSFARDNQLREDIIREWFAQSGCVKANLSEQPVRFGLPPNVICVLPGETQEMIVVGAHTDKVTRAGDGVVDNWSAASLLPSLWFSLSAARRHHTFVFVGFTAEERGMVGSEYYVDHLTPEARAQIEGMVNMDSLGLTPTKVWATHADQPLLDALASVAMASKLPVSAVNVDKIGTTDSESFARYHIPRITLHSITQETMRVLHSPDDKLAAIKMDDYYDSYKLIAEYLAYLDETLKPPSAPKPERAAQ